MSEDKILQKLEQHDAKFEDIIKLLRDFKQEFLQKQDEIMTILKRLDENRIFTAQGLRRLDDEVSEHKAIIQEHDVILGKVKTELNMV